MRTVLFPANCRSPRSPTVKNCQTTRSHRNRGDSRDLGIRQLPGSRTRQRSKFSAPVWSGPPVYARTHSGHRLPGRRGGDQSRLNGCNPTPPQSRRGNPIKSAEQLRKGWTAGGGGRGRRGSVACDGPWQRVCPRPTFSSGGLESQKSRQIGRTNWQNPETEQNQQKIGKIQKSQQIGRTNRQNPETQ